MARQRDHRNVEGTDLYRVVLEDDQVVHIETLLAGLARIRDVETGPDGAIYLLLEHDSGGQIVRLVPEPASTSGLPGRQLE